MVNQIIAWVSSIVLTIGVVWKVVNKYSPKVRKALKITDEVLDVLNSILDAAEDKKITAEEIEVIVKQVEELQAVLK